MILLATMNKLMKFKRTTADVRIRNHLSAEPVYRFTVKKRIFLKKWKKNRKTRIIAENKSSESKKLQYHSGKLPLLSQ